MPDPRFTYSPIPGMWDSLSPLNQNTPQNPNAVIPPQYDPNQMEQVTPPSQLAGPNPRMVQKREFGLNWNHIASSQMLQQFGQFLAHSSGNSMENAALQFNQKQPPPLPYTTNVSKDSMFGMATGGEVDFDNENSVGDWVFEDDSDTPAAGTKQESKLQDSGSAVGDFINSTMDEQGIYDQAVWESRTRNDRRSKTGSVNPVLQEAFGALSSMFPGLAVTSTTGGKHMEGSRHYVGRAIDIGANSSNKVAYSKMKQFLASDPEFKAKFGIEDIIDEGDHTHIELPAHRKGGNTSEDPKTPIVSAAKYSGIQTEEGENLDPTEQEMFMNTLFHLMRNNPPASTSPSNVYREISIDGKRYNEHHSVNTKDFAPDVARTGGTYGEGGTSGDPKPKQAPQPIVVNNPNDPRLKAYQDSLNVYNSGEKAYQSLKNSGEWDLGSEKTISYKEYVDDYNNGRDNFSWFNNGTNQYMHPEEVKKFKGKGILGFLDYANQAKYKKPVQPVVYKKSDSTQNPQSVKPTEYKGAELQRMISDPNYEMFVNSDNKVDFRKKVTKPIHKPEPQLTRQPYNPQLAAMPEAAQVNLPALGTNIPQQQNTYRVEYDNTHRDFPNERIGSEFQRLMSGNRTGYYLPGKKKGGMVYEQGGEYDLSESEIMELEVAGYKIERLDKFPGGGTTGGKKSKFIPDIQFPTQGQDNLTNVPVVNLLEQDKEAARKRQLEMTRTTAKRDAVITQGYKQTASKTAEQIAADRLRLNTQYQQSHPNSKIDENGNLSEKDINYNMLNQPVAPQAKRLDAGLETVVKGLDAATYITGAAELASIGFKTLKAGAKKAAIQKGTQEVLSTSSGMDAVLAKEPGYNSHLFGKQGYVAPTTDPALMATIKPEPWRLNVPEQNTLQIKSLMEGSPLEKQLSKTGQIDIKSLEAHINKPSTSEADRFILNKVLVKNFAGKSKLDYNTLRQAIADELVPLKKDFVDDFANYGVNRLGYTGPKEKNVERAIEAGRNSIASYEKQLERLKSLKDPPEGHQSYLAAVENDLKITKENLQRNIDMLNQTPKENKSILFSNSDKFGKGSSEHFANQTTLGHSRYMVSRDEPDVFHILESQSDYYQKEGAIVAKKISAKGEGDVLAREQKSLSRMKEIQESNINVLDELKGKQASGEKVDGYPVYQYQIDNMTEIVERQAKENAMKEAGLANWHQKSFLGKTHQDRLLQENVAYAAENGHNKVRYPTPETAANIQGYQKEVQGVKTIKQGDVNIEVPNEVYKPEHQTILNKYAELPKRVQRIFGQEVKTVTDPKGNTWYEINIPQKFKDNKAEIKALSTVAGISTAGIAANKKYGGIVEGEEYDMSDEEVEALIKQGYKIQRLK